MTNTARDVIIKGLECVTDVSRKPKRCEECVYNDGIHSGLYTCMPIRIVLDALALLKEERRGKWKTAPTEESRSHWFACSECGDAGDPWDKYCKHCGARMDGGEKDV